MNSQNDNQANTGYQGKETFDKAPYQSQMLPILRGIISAYHLVWEIDYAKVENLEDKITGRLLIDFLEDDDFRKKMQLYDFRFIPESATYDEDYNQIGYTDIRVLVSHKINGFKTTKADYIIECKKLDSGKDLNRKYITNGIYRFVHELYTKQAIHKVSAMLGFVTKKMNIAENIDKINKLSIDENLKTNTILPISYHPISDVFTETYYSKHTTISNKEAEIYHLMLDFSDKMK